MSLQADIQWVQNEVGKITNPRLIEVFKSLLLYREETIEQQKEEVLKEKLTSRALKANEDIKAGRTYTRQEAEAYLADKMKSWK